MIDGIFHSGVPYSPFTMCPEQILKNTLVSSKGYKMMRNHLLCVCDIREIFYYASIRCWLICACRRLLYESTRQGTRYHAIKLAEFLVVRRTRYLVPVSFARFSDLSQRKIQCLNWKTFKMSFLMFVYRFQKCVFPFYDRDI